MAIACSSGAVDPGACVSIETARCQAAPSCPADFNLQQPVPAGNDVASCIRFYQVQCLHGLVTSVTPNSSQVAACVETIMAAGPAATRAHSESEDASAPCGIIANPQNTPACAFLNPADAGEDAGPCSGSSQCAGSTNGGIDCCATIALEANPDGGPFPNCGVSTMSAYCGVCSSNTIGPTCTSIETVHLCSLESDCANETANTQCCQLAGYQACVNSTIAASGLTCL
jgi:hypothetical protein